MKYKYNIATGLQTQQRNIKKYVAGAIVSVIIAGGAAVPAFAANNYCGASDNGCDHAAAAGAQCGTGAASGSFGAFGKDNNFAGGANGYQTGLNNSAVCGNRQGKLPQ